MTGMVYVIEGGEGVGKTTAINNIKSYVSENNLSENYSFYSGSGGTLIGNKCKDIILDNECCDINPLSQLFLFLTARNELYIKIENDILQGKTIIVDRGILSTIAIQLPDISNVSPELLNQLILSVHNDKYCQHIVFLDGNAHNIKCRIDNDWMDEKNINLKWDNAISKFKTIIKSNNNFKFTNIDIHNLSKCEVANSIISLIIK